MTDIYNSFDCQDIVPDHLDNRLNIIFDDVDPDDLIVPEEELFLMYYIDFGESIPIKNRIVRRRPYKQSRRIISSMEDEFKKGVQKRRDALFGEFLILKLIRQVDPIHPILHAKECKKYLEKNLHRDHYMDPILFGGHHPPILSVLVKPKFNSAELLDIRSLLSPSDPYNLPLPEIVQPKGFTLKIREVIPHDPTLKWKCIKQKGDRIDCLITCVICKKVIITHPNHIKAGIPACLSCNTKDNISSMMCEIRGFKFAYVLVLDKPHRGTITYIYFSCPCGFTGRMPFENMRNGAGCIECECDQKERERIIHERANPLPLEQIQILMTHDDGLDWKTVKHKRNRGNCTVICSKCKKSSSFHPNYISAGIAKCVRSACSKLEDVAREMCTLRHWEYLSSERGKKVTKNGRDTTLVARIYFRCDNGHEQKLNYSSMRWGCACIECHNIIRRNEYIKKKENEDSEKEKGKVGYKTCECIGKVCWHYSHAVIYPDSAKEFIIGHIDNKGMTLDKVLPCSDKKFTFLCKNNWCKMEYRQRLSFRSRGHRCPFCTGQAVCTWNCLATTDPELCKEISLDSTYKGTDVTSGSGRKLEWICHKHDTPHIWKASPGERSGCENGCPKCNIRGYDQLVGGHEHFVQEVQIKNPGPYEYPDPYVNSQTKINIWCSVNFKDQYPLAPHGFFAQTPNNHKNGAGCPVCNEERTESKGITSIKALLKLLNIRFSREITLPGMIYKRSLKLDIPLIDLNGVIEFDGEYHTNIIENRGGIEQLEINVLRDCIKDLHCVQNGINLWRIPYTIKIEQPLIENLIKHFKSGKQIYASYPEYIAYVRERFDLSKVFIIEVPRPMTKHCGKKT